MRFFPASQFGKYFFGSISAPPVGVALSDHTVSCVGGTGTGAQQPNINFGFGGSNGDIPPGEFWIYGGSDQGVDTLTVDGSPAPSNAIPGYGLYRSVIASQWWSLGSAPTLADYEIMCHVASGGSPTIGNNVDQWFSLVSEITWGVSNVGALPVNGIWEISIRNAASHVVLTTASMTWEQVA